MARFIWLVFVAPLFAGCATYWVKPGATETDFHRASYDCEREVAMIPRPNVGVVPGYNATQQASAQLGAALGAREYRRDMYAKCMRANGWGQTTQKPR